MYFEVYRGELFIIVLTSFLYNKYLGMILLVTYLLVNLLTESYKNKQVLIKKCRPNTLDNPYGNYLLNSDPKLKSCDDEKKAIAYNTFNLYENAEDKRIGSTNKGLRKFYITPYTTKQNDTIAYINYLKQPILTCKSDGYCLQYDDVRYHSR